ncbi:MAG: hypothetical protein AB1331_09900 [Bacillota bacterium]
MTLHIRTAESGPFELRVRGFSETVPFVPGQNGFLYAVIPEYMVQEGTLVYRIEGSGQRTAWYEVQVGEALPYTDNDVVENGGISILAMATSKEIWFYDVGTFRTYLPNGYNISNVYSQLRSPFRVETSPGQYDVWQDVWPQINCPHNTTRGVNLSNPHRGLDLDMEGGKNVYTVLDRGKVIDVYSSPSYSFVRVSHDLNGDEVYGDIVTKYEHIVPSVNKEDNVSTLTVLGTINPTDGHLHLKFETDTFRSLSQQIFFKNVSHYSNGLDVDFIKEPTLDQYGTLRVQVYGFNIGVRTVASQVSC